MFVKTVFQAVNPATFQVIHGSEDVEEIIRFWDHYLTPKIWNSLLKEAQSCNYDKLKKMMVYLLPETGFVPTGQEHTLEPESEEELKQDDSETELDVSSLSVE